MNRRALLEHRTVCPRSGKPLGALAVALLATGWASCIVDKKTADFQCEADTDCDADRRCESGYCTVGPRAPVDASPFAPDAPPPVYDASGPDARPCPSACTGGCGGNSCLIDCSAADSCASPIVCPPDFACVITCSGTGSCLTTIDCSPATSCTLTCGADGSCSGAVTCGTGRCRVECDGANSCAAGVTCDASCQCDVNCDGATSCMVAATCPPQAQDKCIAGSGCTSAPAQCPHSCP